MTNQSLASQIGRASAVIMIWSIVDKILAVGKEMLTAHRFGVSTELDVFNLANSFPGNIILLFSSTLVAAFVPIYLEWYSHSSEEADSNATWMIYLTTLLFAILTLLCFNFIPEIIQLIGYGFKPREKQMAVILERLLILLIFIDGMGIVFRGIMSARKMFLHLCVAPIFVNIAIIVLMLCNIGQGVYVLVWGFLIGTLIKTVYMAITLRRERFKYGTPLPFDNQKIKALWLLSIPMLGSQLIANSNSLVDQAMATQLPAGSISTLRYAFRINDLPVQVVIASLSRAIFPFISEEIAAGRNDNLQKIFKYSLMFLGFLTFPITCLMVLFSEDLVIILLKRGAFDLEAAHQTSQTLICYSLGLFFYAYTFINGQFFAAMKNARMLLYMGILSIFLNVLFNFLFMHFFGIKGIALSTSATMGIISIWFIFRLKTNLGIISLSQTFSSFSPMILAAAGMLGTGIIIIKLFEYASVPRLILVPCAAVAASICYLGIIWVFRTEDLNSCITLLTNKFIKPKYGR